MIRRDYLRGWSAVIIAIIVCAIVIGLMWLAFSALAPDEPPRVKDAKDMPWWTWIALGVWFAVIFRDGDRTVKLDYESRRIAEKLVAALDERNRIEKERLFERKGSGAPA